LSGIALERSVKGRVHRYSLRAWSPFTTIPAEHFSREELAQFLGLEIPVAAPRKRGGIRI
jgi:hypothetical protein